MSQIIIGTPKIYIQEDDPLVFTATEGRTTLLNGVANFAEICPLPGEAPEVRKSIISDSKSKFGSIFLSKNTTSNIIASADQIRKT